MTFKIDKELVLRILTIAIEIAWSPVALIAHQKRYTEVLLEEPPQELLGTPDLVEFWNHIKDMKLSHPDKTMVTLPELTTIKPTVFDQALIKVNPMTLELPEDFKRLVSTFGAIEWSGGSGEPISGPVKV